MFAVEIFGSSLGNYIRTVYISQCDKSLNFNCSKVLFDHHKYGEMHTDCIASNHILWERQNEARIRVYF